MNIAYGIFGIGFITLIVTGIKIMEFIKVSDVYGNFTYSEKNIVRVSAIIVNSGFSSIDIKNIELMIKEKTKKSYIIRGVEIREGDKLISIREFSSSYGARNKRIEVQLIKGVTLRLINLPIEIDHKIKSNLLKAVLVIKTLNSVQNIIYHVTFGMFAKKKYKFKIKCHWTEEE